MAERELIDDMVEQLVEREVQEQHATDLVQTIVDDALAGRMAWTKNVSQTIDAEIAKLDALISTQLRAIMQHEKFRQLEGSWRGLDHLVTGSDPGTITNTQIKVLDVTKPDLHADLTKADALEASQIYRKVYYEQYDTGGGKPFGALVGDYAFENRTEDLEVLDHMGRLGADAFCPFLAAAAPHLIGLKDFASLTRPRDLNAVFEGPSFAKWRSLREKDHARYVGLTLPRVLARLPYGAATRSIEEFAFDEVPAIDADHTAELDNSEYCWMNSAYAYATRLAQAFAATGWYAQVRGQEGGGKVADLPVHTMRTAQGDIVGNCPTEVHIWFEREKELSDAGFLTLLHHKDTDFAVFDGAQSIQKPARYVDAELQSSAQLSARLPYVFVTARIAHYLKVLAHRSVGSGKRGTDLERDLQAWVANYVCDEDQPETRDPAARAKRPLRAARIRIVEDEENPGVFSMEADLVPRFQFDELRANLHVVSSIPRAKS